MKNVLIIFFALLFLLLWMKWYTSEHFDGSNTDNKDVVPAMKRPYVNLFTQNGEKLNVILISKPFSGDAQYKIYEDNKKNNIFIGIASYLEFPNMVSNPFENFTENYKKYKYKEIAEGWIHCFRDPEKYFPPDMPILFASESDWADCNNMKPDNSLEKKYDFIYICLKVDQKKKLCDDWATYNKNWKLAQKCLDVMCNKFKLKGLLIGRKGCLLPNGCSDLMEVTDMLGYNEMKKKYNESKFIFVPNEKDASPRVLTEALCMNIPALINKNILGGWKYINEQTGEFFTNENDIENSIKIMLDKLKENTYTPRKYFLDNYGVKNAGAKLKDYLYKNWGDRINIPIDNVEYITPEFEKKNYKSCEL